MRVVDAGPRAPEVTRIHLSAPDVGAMEEAFVLDAIRSGWVAPMGAHVDAFEAEMASRLGVAAAVALSSGTAALHLGLLELGAGPGSVVVVPTMTFAATANAVCYTGARPVFVDCTTDSGNLDVDLLDSALTTLTAEGQHVAAVVPVDLLGRCVDYSALLPVCERFGVPVLEDAAEALGASHRGRPAGSFGAAGVLSFNGNKIMTTSGGGMLLTDDERLAARVRYLGSQARQPVAHYEHTEIGHNYRLSNLLAALGRAQLTRLDEMIGRRRGVRRMYEAVFAAVDGVRLLGSAADREDNCWLTAIVVDPAHCRWTPAELVQALETENIEVRPLWKPMHRQPVFSGARSFLTGAADGLFGHGVTLPSGSSLGPEDLTRVRSALDRFLAGRA